MRNLSANLLVTVAGYVILGTCIGCGSDYPETAQVHGIITYRDAPVTTGRIIFYPTSGARLSSGEIQPDGSYTLTTFKPNDGALLGKHRVTITSTKVLGPATATSIEEEAKTQTVPGQSRVVWLVEEKYSNETTSDLEAEVKPGKNRIDFKFPLSDAAPAK